MPCPSPNCKGYMYNTTLINKLCHYSYYDGIEGFVNYPPHISGPIIAKYYMLSSLYPNKNASDIMYELSNCVECVPDLVNKGIDYDTYWDEDLICEFDSACDMMACRECEKFYTIL